MQMFPIFKLDFVMAGCFLLVWYRNLKDELGILLCRWITNIILQLLPFLRISWSVGCYFSTRSSHLGHELTLRFPNWLLLSVLRQVGWCAVLACITLWTEECWSGLKEKQCRNLNVHMKMEEKFYFKGCQKRIQKKQEDLVTQA